MVIFIISTYRPFRFKIKYQELNSPSFLFSCFVPQPPNNWEGYLLPAVLFLRTVVEAPVYPSIDVPPLLY
jgi:hypothetical protein